MCVTKVGWFHWLLSFKVILCCKLLQMVIEQIGAIQQHLAISSNIQHLFT